MENKERISQIKESLKREAIELRQLKFECKEGQRGTNTSPRVWQEDVLKLKRIWRHKHIAYCLLRGRTLEQIERKTRLANKPNRILIRKYFEEFGGVDD